MVPIQHQSTGRTDMGTSREAFPDPLATARTILAGEVRWRRYDGYTGNLPVIVEPAQKQPPTGIADTLGKVMVLDEVGNLQIFIGNQVVRRDERTCRLGGEVFTLPGNFQMTFGESFDGSLAILGALHLA